MNKKQIKALSDFEACYVSGENNSEPLKRCLEYNVDLKFIYDITIYHKKCTEYINFGNTFGWDALLKKYKLPERFIIENIDKLNWDDISAYQNLSEDFIIEYSDKLNWGLLFLRQDIEFSGKLLEEYQSYIKNSIINTLYDIANS